MSVRHHIGILGSYDASSQGDLAILLGMLGQIYRRWPSAVITVFAFDPQAVRQALAASFPRVQVVPAHPAVSKSGVSAKTAGMASGEDRSPPFRLRGWRAFLERWPVLYDVALIARYAPFWRQQQRRLKAMDALLIGGGGLLVDLYAKWPVYPLLYTWLARRVGTPVMFYAVGVGPITTRRGRRYFSWALNLAQAATVRDGRSWRLARQLVRRPDKVVLAADPAFCLSPTSVSVSSPETASRPRVGLVPVAIHHPCWWPVPDAARYATYVQRMAALAANLANTLAAEVVLFSTNCPQDLFAARDILKHAQPRLTAGQVRVFEPCGLEALRVLWPTLDVVVATRLHALILAMVHRVPVVALAYQDKVEALFEDMGAVEQLFPIAPLLEGADTAFERLQQRVLEQVQALLVAQDAVREPLAQMVASRCRLAHRSLEVLSPLLSRA